MPEIDKTAQSLYARFSAVQLRDLALAGNASAESVAGARSKEAVLDLVNRVSGQDRLALLAHRVETLSPYKHCVLLQPRRKLEYEELLLKCKTSFPHLFSSFFPLQSDSTDLIVQMCVADSDSKRLFIKFAHMVEVWESKRTPDGLLRQKVRRRHIMVVSISTSLQIVTISFPGFSQPVQGSDQISYNSFALQIVSLLEQSIALSLSAFALKPATDLLIEEKTEGVVDLKRTLMFEQGGKMSLDSQSDRDAATALALGLAGTGVVLSAETIRTALKSSEAQSILLLWQKQRLLTRLSMRQSLPEVLFIWDEADPSVSLIDEIIGKFSWAHTLSGTTGIAEARRSIKEKSAGEVIRPTWLQQHYGIDRDEALKLLLDASSERLCTPVFRLRPDKLLRVPQGWVTYPSDLPKTALDSTGNIVDCNTAESIEIGFRRSEG